MSSSVPGHRKRGHLDSLIGARAIGSLLVFISHCGMEPVFQHRQINDTIFTLFIAPGESAVSFFFMLSGFVLVWAAKPTDTTRSFYRRRLVKIYPNVIVTWVAGLILMIMAGEFTGLLKLLPGLVLIHDWIPVPSILEGVDGPSWSLSAEVFFYALFPLLFALLWRIKQGNLWRWVAGVLATMIVITVVVGAFAPDTPQTLGKDVSATKFYLLIFAPPVRLLDFALGMLVARIVLEGLMPKLRWSWVLLALAAAWVAGSLIPAPMGWSVTFAPAEILVLGRATAADEAGEKNILNSRLAVYLGNTSFAFYLIHWLVLHFGRVFLGGGPWSTPVATAFLLSAYVVTIGLAHLLYSYVEVPAMRRWARPRPPASRPAVQPAGTAAQDSVITPTGAAARVE